MLPGGKGGWCVGLTTLPPSCADCLEIWEPHPLGLSRPVMRLLYLIKYLISYITSNSCEKFCEVDCSPVLQGIQLSPYSRMCSISGRDKKFFPFQSVYSGPRDYSDPYSVSKADSFLGGKVAGA